MTKQTCLQDEVYEMYSKRVSISRAALTEYEQKGVITGNGERITIFDVQSGDSLLALKVGEIYMGICGGDDPEFGAHLKAGGEKWYWIWNTEKVKKYKDKIEIFGKGFQITKRGGLEGGVYVDWGRIFSKGCSGSMQSKVIFDGKEIELYRLKV